MRMFLFPGFHAIEISFDFIHLGYFHTYMLCLLLSLRTYEIDEMLAFAYINCFSCSPSQLNNSVEKYKTNIANLDCNIYFEWKCAIKRRNSHVYKSSGRMKCRVERDSGRTTLQRRENGSVSVCRTVIAILLSGNSITNGMDGTGRACNFVAANDNFYKECTQRTSSACSLCLTVVFTSPSAHDKISDFDKSAPTGL